MTRTHKLAGQDWEVDIVVLITREYWHVPLDGDVSVPISAFVMPYGHFQWRYMPFGFLVGHQTATGFRKLLRSLPWWYSHFSDTWEEHLARIRAVLTRIRSVNLTLSPSKCHFDGRLPWTSHRFRTRPTTYSKSTGFAWFSGANHPETTATVFAVGGLPQKRIIYPIF